MRRWIRLGWGWTAFSGWGLAGAAVGAGLFWLLEGTGGPTGIAYWTGGGLAGVGFLRAVEASNARSIAAWNVLARLDEGWGMRQRLCAAAEGAGEWPAPPAPGARLPIRVRWKAGAPPVLLGVGFGLLAVWIPYPVSDIPDGSRPAEPPGWRSMETWVEALEEDNGFEPADLERFRQEVETLRASPVETWYRPAVLEATDRLRSRVEGNAARMAEGLTRAAELLNRMNPDANPSGALRTGEGAEEMRRLLEELGREEFSLSDAQLARLRQVDLSSLTELDAERLSAVEAELRARGEALERAMVGAGLLAPGGGPDGGGPADLGPGAGETTARPVVPVGLESRDAEAARMGDLLELRDLEHEERIAETPGSAGAVRSSGGGGAAVWREHPVPREQKVLRSFFQSNSTSSPATETP